MKHDKLDELNIYAGVDTLQVRTRTPVKSDTPLPFITHEVTKEKGDNNEYSYYILNPDKGNNDLPIYNSADYHRTLNSMLDLMEIEKPLITRIDYRLDSFDENFTDYAKLNKLVILLISQEYNVTNRYESRDLLTNEALTIRIQNRHIEAENYNKSLQEPNDIVKNRLELRSKSVYTNAYDFDTTRREFLKWCKRLDKSVTAENIDTLLHEINIALLERFKEWTERKGHKLNSFIQAYENSIFTRRQLIDLFSLMGLKNPVKRADNYKRSNEIEYFSLRNILDYVQKIKQSGADFFGEENTQI